MFAVFQIIPAKVTTESQNKANELELTQFTISS